MSHHPHSHSHSRSYSNNSGLLPSRPVFGANTSDAHHSSSSSSLTEQLKSTMNDIITGYLSNEHNLQIECIEAKYV